MDAALIAIGSELLGAGRKDTNGDWLVERLEGLGFTVRTRTAVGDEIARIARTVRHERESCDVVILTGGLGPTDDDRTRDGLAEAFGLAIERDEVQVEHLRERYRRRGFPFRDDQARQADRPRGAVSLENTVGAAPGLLLGSAVALVFALPGVPSEMRAMFERSVRPVLERLPRPHVVRRVISIAGRTESSVDAAVRDLYDAEGITVTILAGTHGVELHLRAEGSTPDDALTRVDALDAAMSERLGDDVFGRDGTSLAEVIGRELERRSMTLATAESCTAGLLAGEITTVAGSSAWYRGGAVVYADDLKTALAGVEAGTVRACGAVSAPVAIELATGIRRRCGADLGVGITGIAGPGGGTPEKPVGLIHWALDDGRRPRDGRWLLPGDRRLVRGRTVILVLDQVRRYLQERP